MHVRDTSLEAYRELRPHLQPMEARVMAVFHAVGHEGRTFTRRELRRFCDLEINSLTARVKSLLDKGFLIELEERRDGGHLLRLP